MRTADLVWTHFEAVRDDRRRVLECSCNYCDYKVKWPKLEMLHLHLQRCKPEATNNKHYNITTQNQNGLKRQGQHGSGPSHSHKYERSNMVPESDAEAKVEIDHFFGCSTNPCASDTPVEYLFDIKPEIEQEPSDSMNVDVEDTSDLDTHHTHRDISSSLNKTYYSSQRKCLFCRTNVNRAGAGVPGTRHQNSIGSDISYNSNYKATGAVVCDVLELDKSFLFYFKDAVYCKSCQDLVNKVQINLRTLYNVQKKIATQRKTIKTLLRKNVERVSTYLDPLRASRSRPSATLTYDETVKSICQGLSIVIPGNNDGVAESSCNLSPAQERGASVHEFPDEKPNARLSRSLRPRIKPTISFNKVKCAPSDYDSDQGSDFDAASLLYDPVDNSRCGRSDENENTSSASDAEAFDDSDSDYNSNSKRKSSKSVKRQLKSASIRKIRTKTKLQCKITDCDFTCTKPGTMEVHVRGIHEGNPRPYNCDLCPMTFTNSTSQKYHLVRHTSNPTIECSYCSKLFFERWQLKKHVQSVHMTQKNLKCHICSFKLESSLDEDLKAHLSLHEERSVSKPYSCVMCEKDDFNNYFDLKLHVGTEHQSEDGSETTKCPKCERKFNTARLLKVHLDGLFCEQNPDLRCKICPDFVARNKIEYLRHLPVHEEERQYVCEQCGLAFKTCTALRLHSRIHTGEKPYKCLTCEKSFRLSFLLKRHQEVHLSVKNYECKGCGKKFRASNNLKQHLRGHCNSGGVKRSPNNPKIRTEPESTVNTNNSP